MPDVPMRIHSLSELRTYVLHTLCEHENLIPEQFELQEMVLTRQGTPCGRQFLLQGPRSVRLGAVWAGDRNDLYFYDARGERFHKERIAFDDSALSEAA